MSTSKSRKDSNNKYAEDRAKEMANIDKKEIEEWIAKWKTLQTFEEKRMAFQEIGLNKPRAFTIAVYPHIGFDFLLAFKNKDKE